MADTLSWFGLHFIQCCWRCQNWWNCKCTSTVWELFLKITSTKRQDSLPERVHTVLKNKGGHSTFNLDRIVKRLVLPYYCISIYVCTCQEITVPIFQANYKEIGSGQDFIWLSVSINLKIQYDGQCFFSNCFLRQL